MEDSLAACKIVSILSSDSSSEDSASFSRSRSLVAASARVDIVSGLGEQSENSSHESRTTVHTKHRFGVQTQTRTFDEITGTALDRYLGRTVIEIK